MIAPDARGSPDEPLRTEHDELARRLESRASVDEARRGLLRLFVGLIAVGLAVKLAFDRWGPLAPGAVRKLHRGPPLFLWLAAAAAVVLLVLAARALLAARRLSRDEARLYARFRHLRAALGLDR
jgi:hypothetical protein